MSASASPPASADAKPRERVSSGSLAAKRAIVREAPPLHRFKVHLREFTCENLVTGDAKTPCEAYLLIDFGGQKRFKTDFEPDNNNPEWGFKTGFHYNMNFLDQLNRKELRVQCFNKANSRLLGKAAVNLHTVACGPEHYQLTLHTDSEEGEPKGVLKFTCVMRMLSQDLTVVCSDLSLVMQGCNAPATLTLTASGGPSAPQDGDEHVNDVVREHSGVGSWPGPFSFVYETTLKDFLRYDESPEHLHFVFTDESGTEQGEAYLEFRKWIPSLREKEQVLHFKLPVTYKGASDETEAFGNVGEVEGDIHYQNLPVFAQMVGGSWIDDHVQGSRLFAEGLPYPKCVETPTVWQERHHFDLLKAEGEDDPDEIDHFDDKHLAQLLASIDLPPPWEKRRERPGGRMYFFDPRARRMTWKDPRFLPENWDQRIDPASGRVYYQYHKTRQHTYNDPRCCPAGWDMRLSRVGDVYFAYLPAMKTTFLDPRGLPENISPALDVLGRTYFKNHESKSTTWKDPREDQPEVMLAHWRHEESVRWIRDQVRRELQERYEEAHSDSDDD